MEVRDLVSTKGRKALFETRRLLPLKRALPEFIVIGAQKSGTSSMFAYLKQHPRILRPLIKEPYFFDRHYARGLNWYSGNFPALRTIQRLDDKIGEPHYTFEATATYVFNPVVPARIARDLTTRRFITLLRNPVDRAISAYWHAKRQGIETRSLEDAIESDLARYEAEQANGPGATPTPKGPPSRPSYLRRGIYHEAIASWRTHFAADEMLVIQSETMFADPALVMRQVFGFLGLSMVAINYEAQNVGRYETAEIPIRQTLQSFYQAHNDTLCGITGRSFSW